MFKANAKGNRKLFKQMTESTWPTAQQLAKINQTALKETKNMITKDKTKKRRIKKIEFPKRLSKCVQQFNKNRYNKCKQQIHMEMYV